MNESGGGFPQDPPWTQRGTPAQRVVRIQSVDRGRPRSTPTNRRGAPGGWLWTCGEVAHPQALGRRKPRTQGVPARLPWVPVDVTLRCSYTRVDLYTFIWDPAKNKANQQKHGVSFEEATEAFEDENGLMLEDDEHSYDEPRFLLLGAAFNHLLTVCFCERGTDEDGNEFIRIISARPASRSERRLYLTRGQR